MDEPMILWSISAPQKKMLTEWLPSYKTAYIKRQLEDYWHIFFMSWFRRWPAGSDESRRFSEEVSNASPNLDER